MRVKCRFHAVLQKIPHHRAGIRRENAPLMPHSKPPVFRDSKHRHHQDLLHQILSCCGSLLPISARRTCRILPASMTKPTVAKRGWRENSFGIICRIPAVFAVVLSKRRWLGCFPLALPQLGNGTACASHKYINLPAHAHTCQPITPSAFDDKVIRPRAEISQARHQRALIICNSTMFSEATSGIDVSQLL